MKEMGQMDHITLSISPCKESVFRKGLYAKARAGIIPQFTGISDPYEAPEHAEIVIDTPGVSPEQAADRIPSVLEERGFLTAYKAE